MENHTSDRLKHGNVEECKAIRKTYCVPEVDVAAADTRALDVQ